MKKSSCLFVISVFIIFGALISCSGSDNLNSDNLIIGAHPVDNDRALPYDYSDWMSYIHDGRYLSELSIPGTHDSGADLHTSQQGALSSYVISQNFRLSNQLKLGVRWFDIRLRLSKGALTVHHGPYYLHKNFDDLLNAAGAFLRAHPSECVIFMIKQEHSNESNHDFAAAVWNRIAAHPEINFWLDNHIPQLGQVRGKLIIMRRFNSDAGHPMGAPLIWDDNTKGAYFRSDNFSFYVQDHYSLGTVSINTKISEIKDGLRRAHAEPEKAKHYYINFTSGEKQLSETLENIAAPINSAINDFIRSGEVSGSSGVVIVNFAGGSDNGKVGPDLVKTIIENNHFDFVRIGSQVWMNSNWIPTHYRNGDPIPHIRDDKEWSNLTTGAYCEYSERPMPWTNTARLYNWFAVNDPRGFCPRGWRVPTAADWATLINYLGGDHIAGGKLKATGTTTWQSPNTGATNETGFNAFPHGIRDYRNGVFLDNMKHAFFWTSTDGGANGPYAKSLAYNSASVSSSSANKKYGFSVRCVRD